MTDADEQRSPSLIPEAWGEVVTGYESSAEKLTQLFVDPLLEAAGPCDGCRLLDVGCGPGVVALEAAHRGSRVTAVDFSADMVSRAKARLAEAGFEEADCRVADVESMDFDDGTFELAVSNFAVMFAPHPERAFAELARVLESGGRFAMTTWTAPENQGFFRVVGGAMRRALPDFDPPGPPIWEQFKDPDVLVDYLEGTGFTDVVVETVTRKWEVPSAGWFVDDIDGSSPAVTYLFESLTAEEQARFKRALHGVLTDQYGDGAFELDAEAHIASATA